jgi:hypothetical protein
MVEPEVYLKLTPSQRGQGNGDISAQGTDGREVAQADAAADLDIVPQFDPVADKTQIAEDDKTEIFRQANPVF